MAEILFDDDGLREFLKIKREQTRSDPSIDWMMVAHQNVSGTGLGLTLARDFARAHGGDIRLEDSPMGGLRVRLRLPY